MFLKAFRKVIRLKVPRRLDNFKSCWNVFECIYYPGEGWWPPAYPFENRSHLPNFHKCESFPFGNLSQMPVPTLCQTFPKLNKNHSYSPSQTFKRGRTFPTVAKSLWKCEPFSFAFSILSKTWHNFCDPYLAQHLHNGIIILSDVLPLVLPFYPHCYHS